MRVDPLLVTQKAVKKTLRGFGILPRVNFKMTKRINGRCVKIPIIKEIGLTNLGSPDEWMVKILKLLLGMKEGTFIDVGVNVGQTLIKLKTLDPSREYLGFEPNPVCVFYVRQLIEENGFKNCTVIPVGLSDRASLAHLEFLDNEEVGSSASIINGFRPSAAICRKEYVPVFPLSQIHAALELSEISIFKIDVEGAELEVMRSARQVISEYRPFVVLEVLPVYSPENEMRKIRQDELEKILSDINYSIFRVTKTKNGALKGLLKIRTIGIHSDLMQTDYISVPNELEKDLVKECSKIFGPIT